MDTHLVLDDQLLQKALLAGQHRTKKAVVTEALEEYIERRKQHQIVELFGSIDYDADFDYKEQRKRL